MANETLRDETTSDDLVEVRDPETDVDQTDTGIAVGGLGGAAIGAATGAVAGPVGAVVGGVVGGTLGAVAGGLAGAAADNEATPPASSVPISGNAGYGADVDTGLLGVTPTTTDDSP